MRVVNSTPLTLHLRNVKKRCNVKKRRYGVPVLLRMRQMMPVAQAICQGRSTNHKQLSDCEGDLPVLMPCSNNRLGNPEIHRLQGLEAVDERCIHGSGPVITSNLICQDTSMNSQPPCENRVLSTRIYGKSQSVQIVKMWFSS